MRGCISKQHASVLKSCQIVDTFGGRSQMETKTKIKQKIISGANHQTTATKLKQDLDSSLSTKSLSVSPTSARQ